MNKITFPRYGVDGVYCDKNEIEEWFLDNTYKDVHKKIKDVHSGDPYEETFLRFVDHHLDHFLIASPRKLEFWTRYIDNKLPISFVDADNHSTPLGNDVLRAFQYSSFRKNVLVDLAKKINVKTCPYCNMHYTLYANEKVKYKQKSKTLGLTRFQFDHFYDKLHYPMLSMSFYNLIPTCAVCNQGKSAKALSLSYHPYYSDIHKLFHFEVAEPLEPYTAARVKDEVEIALVPEPGVDKDKFEEYIGTFHLKSLYGRHGDVVQEAYDKAYEMPYYLNPTNFDFLSNKDTDYLEQLWMGNYTKPEEIEKRPMAKFMQDIWRQAKGEM